MDLAAFEAAWLAAASAEPAAEPSAELVAPISAAVGLPETADAPTATAFLRALATLLEQPGAAQVADQFSFELFPTVARLLPLVGPDGAALGARCLALLARLCSAREIALLAVEVLEPWAAGSSRKGLAATLGATVPALAIAHGRVAERGGRQAAELSRKLARALPLLLDCLRLLSAHADDLDDASDDEDGPQDDPGAEKKTAELLQHAGALTALADFVHSSLPSPPHPTEAAAAAPPASDPDQEEERHLVRYLLARFGLCALALEGPEAACAGRAKPVRLLLRTLGDHDPLALNFPRRTAISRRWGGCVAGRCGWRAAELLADFNHSFLQASGVGPVDDRCEGTLQPRAMVSHHRLQTLQTTLVP